MHRKVKVLIAGWLVSRIEQPSRTDSSYSRDLRGKLYTDRELPASIARTL
jgi:hypothetical protein